MALVLIVDDEALIALAYQNTVMDEGHSVVMASDGRRALEVLARQRPDCIITDYMMPRMDGAELVRAVRADPALASIPIIMNTALAPEVMRAKALPVQAILHKPVRAEALADTLHRVLLDAASV